LLHIREDDPVVTVFISSYADAKELEGTHVGYSEYFNVSQEMVTEFGVLTGDEQWIHLDVERSKKDSPFGQTIVHGYLTLSLGPRLFETLISVNGFSSGVNYGCNRVRFISPLLVGANLRLGVEVTSVEGIPGGCQMEALFTFESDRSERPVCVAENVFRYFD
jgi:acyl dehydratase